MNTNPLRTVLFVILVMIGLFASPAAAGVRSGLAPLSLAVVQGAAPDPSVPVPEEVPSGPEASPSPGGEYPGVASYWHYPLLRVEGQSITPGKITVALVLLAIGYLVSRWIRSLLHVRLLMRLRIREGAAAALGTVIFYTLLTIFGLIALQIAGLPLHAFTLVGGAAAIGVGFGSQNIINNFMSGLILLVERPVNVGDLIQLGDLTGRVERIGPRSTRVRTGENVEIIVPNSSFLESNVINWTLTDPDVRVHVTVGVCYGSPTEEVMRILREVVEDHPRVKQTPAPIVLFTDFGDNSLNFQVHFWIEMKTTIQRRIIESEIRFAIDARFREADIVIAFPQRDVHLDTVRPLDVRVLER